MSKLDHIQTIRELIDARAESHPDLKFLLSPDTGRTVTFKELQDGSRLLSARLAAEGLAPGDKIAFLMDNGLFAAELFLGAMYGGYVMVPLNVRAGASQLSYTVDHCDAKVVFVADKYQTLITEVLAGVRHPVRVIPADVDGIVHSETKLEAPTHVPGPEDMAMLMYTSGSTGQPKAAIHSHRTIMAQGRNSVVSHELVPEDRSLLVLPLYHINAECVTLIPTLLSGGSVVVPHHFVVSDFWNWIQDHGCTWSALVPTIISQLIDFKDPKAGQRAEAFKRIRFLRSSSAPLSPALHQEFIDKFKLPLIQAMGSTECGNIFSNPVPPGVNKIGSPGLPWGFEARIVNREGVDLPANEPGEVLLRGPAMMEAYYKDPVTTAAALDGERWLHTGDLAYRDEDGYFFVVGRSKELIIKAGMNIAPKQIDEVIESHPSVLEAAAVGVPDRYVGEDLVAFVVLRDGLSCDEREMLAFCEERLGHFKTPTRIHFVDDLPKGPSGKVQRLRLVEEAAKPAVARSVSLATHAEAAPASNAKLDIDVEQTIAEIWTELLGKTGIGPKSNFFELGGHSLMAIQCLSKLRQKVPVMLSLTDFFEHATVAQLAALVKQRFASAPPAQEGETAELTEEQPIPLRDQGALCPMSPAQQRIWFIEQLAPEALSYNEAEAVRLKGDLDVEALEQAFNIIVSRHELLRSTIKTTDSKSYFVVHDEWPLEFKVTDLGGLKRDEQDSEVDRLLISEPRKPYNLEKAPGIRVTLVRLNAREHVLILMMHHIICDWSSEGVLWRELSAQYHALLHGESFNMPTLPIQHGDYAAWQEKQYDPSNFRSDLDFWKKNLEGAAELLDLPADRPRPHTLTYRGARRRVPVSGKLAEALRQLSRKEKTSLFTIFAAALNVLLYRYTGREDILLGIPLADRDKQELQSMIGFLLHMQVLRTPVDGQKSFSDLLSKVQRGALEMFAHRAVPFDLVVRELGHERNLAYSPLFQVMLNWRDREQELSYIGMEGLQIESVLAEARTAKFDLTLMATDGGDEIMLEWEYSTDLFDEARILRMADHYLTLLDAVAAGPEQKVADLPLLTEPEKQQILVEWNRTEVDYPHEAILPQLIDEQVARTPDKTAVVFAGRKLSYRELNERANQLANYLQKLGVGPDSLVAICVDRSLEMVVAMLGVLKAGGAYVPLDPKYPKDRIAYVVQDADSKVFLTQSSLLPDMPESQAQMVRMDADWDTIAQESTMAPQTGAKADHLAYVIYTSGSTGLPKGVEISHRALVNFLLSMKERPGLTADDVLLGVTTISFDIAGLETWLPLITGAKLVVLSRDDASDGFRVLHHLQAEKATVLQATPSTWRMLLDAKWPGTPRLKMLCGGEAMPRDLADQLLAKGGQLWNMYGPTETTIWSSCTLVPRDKSTIHIGQPIANTQLYILDPQLKPVPIGIPGELHIGGDGLARGYHNRADLTAQKFIPDPFSTDPGARLYKTGDSSRFLPSGDIEYLGRLDHQVKIRGFRIELGEIEEVLNKLPGVAAGVVVAREDTPGDKRLVAYVTSQNGALPVEALKDGLKAKLPDYMVPSAFVTLEKMPLTPNGKVDRKALPKPDFAAAAKEKFVAPSTLTEIVLAGIWCDVLGLKKIGVHDDFFELGGHSLLAVKLFTEIRKRFNVQFGLSTLFEARNVAALAALIGKEESSGARKERGGAYNLVPIRLGGTSTPPLFLVHDIGGTVLRYEHLGRHFPGGQTIYAMESRGLSGLPVDYDVPSMARNYIEAMKKQQPQGPYHVVGHCFGGLVAYEMAQQMARDNDRLAFLGLLDTHQANLAKDDLLEHERMHSFGGPPFHQRVKEDLRILAFGPGRIACLQQIWRTIRRRVTRTSYRIAYRVLSALGRPMPAFMRNVDEANRIASAAYTPQPYDGEVVLFQCANRIPSDPPDSSRLWQKLVRKSTVFHVPGDHNSMLVDPNVRVLTEQLAGFMSPLARPQKSNLPAHETLQGESHPDLEKVS